MRTRTTVLATLAATALIAGGCGDDDDDEGGGDAAAEPVVLALTATATGKEKAIEGPETVQAGLTTITLRNTDTVEREAQLIRIEGDQTVQDVLKAVSSEGGPLPQFIQDGGGVAPTPPGQNGKVTQVLAPGRYVAFDTGEGEGENVKNNAELGAVQEFRVTGEASDAELPEVPGRITAKDVRAPGQRETEYSFTASGLKAGTNRVRFENTGEQLHHAILFPLNEGATIADAEKAFSEEEPSGPPPVDFENATGTTVIDGDYAQNVELELKSGNYAAVCFIQDRKGGKPHVAKGMISEVTVE